MRHNLTRNGLLCCLILLLASCQKEISIDLGSSGSGSGGNGGSGGSGGNNTSNIVGSYDFVGLSAHTLSSVSVTQGGQTAKSVTTSDYSSINNSGTIQITANQIIATNLAYAIDTVMNVKTYLDNVLIDNSDLPFAVTLPATSSTSTYTRIRADSLSVTGGIGTAPNPSGVGPTGPTGVKLAWSGDTLLLKVNSSFTQTITQGGVPAQMIGSVNGVTKLKKR